MTVFVFPFLSSNSQVAYIQRCAFWEQQPAATMGGGEDDECRWNVRGETPWKTERRNNHNFIRDFR